MSDTNFLKQLALLNAATEIPRTFTGWTALSAISAVLGRKVWLHRGPITLYPNLYVVLVAGSGGMRKSTSIGVVQPMLEKIIPPIRLISQKMTAEKLINVLKNGQETPVVSSPSPVGGQGFLIAGELTNFLNRTSNEGGMLTILTEFYDCRNRFEMATISRGVETVHNTQLGMLAATTPDELRKAMPEGAIGAGLASRCLFVYSDTRPGPITWPDYDAEQVAAREFCEAALQRFASLSGQVTINTDCRKWGTVCYEQRCYNSPLVHDPLLSGYASRRFDLILKLAIIFTIATTEQLHMTLESLELAEALIIKNEEYLQKVIRLVTMNEKGSIISYVNSLIVKHRKIDRRTLLTLVAHRVDSSELVQIIETLKASSQIMITSNGSSIIYTSTDVRS